MPEVRIAKGGNVEQISESSRSKWAKSILRWEGSLHPRLFRMLLKVTLPWLQEKGGYMPAAYGALEMRFNLLDTAERQGWLGTYDPSLSNLLKRFCQPGMTAIDVGTNVGIISATIASLVRETGYVLMVEPNPALARRLQDVIDRNPYKNLHLEEVAVDVKTGTLPFYVSSAHTYSTLVKEKLPDYPLDSVVNVRVVRLDDVLNLIPAERTINLLKLDAEGVDLTVMLDALPAIAERKIELIVVEAQDKLVDEVIQQYLQKGYHAWAIDGATHQLRPWGTIATANANLFMTLPSPATEVLFKS